MKVLEVELPDGTTLREFFIQSMVALWEEGESFSGKRPLGDSGWQIEIAAALIETGLLTGTLNDRGDADEFDWNELDKLIVEAVEQI